MKLLLFCILSVLPLAAQTTTISASVIRDQTGNLVTGSLCFGPNICTNITAGAISQLSVPNGTYNVWVNSGLNQIINIPSATLSGAPVSADTYLANLFAASVGGTTVYLTSSVATFTCNGNAVILPGQPTNFQQLTIINLSTTTACTVAGNGNSIIYQSASVSPASLPAKNIATTIFVQNYDYATHNAWIVTHLGT